MGASGIYWLRGLGGLGIQRRRDNAALKGLCSGIEGIKAGKSHLRIGPPRSVRQGGVQQANGVVADGC